MKYSAVFIAAVVASGALAAPGSHGQGWGNNNHNAGKWGGGYGGSHGGQHGGQQGGQHGGQQGVKKPITVLLGKNKQVGAKLRFEDVARSEDIPRRTGPFNMVQLKIDESVDNQELRCQLIGDDNQAVNLRRGQNEDTTFAKGNPWTFIDGEIKVKKVICNERFVKGGDGEVTIQPFPLPEDDDVLPVNNGANNGQVQTPPINADEDEVDEDDVVIDETKKITVGLIQSTGGTLQTQTDGFVEAERTEKKPTDRTTLYDRVELNLGSAVDPEYRCQILDLQGNIIKVVRGGPAVDTFADKDNGPWTFPNGPTAVGNIICDPTFKAAAPAPAAGAPVPGAQQPAPSQQPAAGQQPAVVPPAAQ